MFLVRKTFESKILEYLVSVSPILAAKIKIKRKIPFFKLYCQILTSFLDHDDWQEQVY